MDQLQTRQRNHAAQITAASARVLDVLRHLKVKSEKGKMGKRGKGRGTPAAFSLLTFFPFPTFPFFMKIEPVTLDGEFVRLEPLEAEHFDALCEVGMDPELWRWTGNIVRSREDLRRYVDIALADRDRGVSLPFVTRDKAAGKIVGSTRFGNID